MRFLGLLLPLLAGVAFAQTPNGVINAPIYATGYISQVGGTNVTTNILPQPNHPTNLNIYTTGAISGTWTIKLPNPAFEGQVLSFNCGAAANAISITSSDGSSIDSNLPTSCSANGGFIAQFDLRSNIWRSLGSGYSANFRPFTGVASQWPWQLNADGSWVLRRPDAVDVTFTQSGSSTPETVSAVLGRTYYADQFSSLSQAVTQAASTCGIVVLGPYQYTLTADLVVPQCVKITSPQTPSVSAYQSNWGVAKYAIYVPSSYTIRLSGTLENVFVLQSGIFSATSTLRNLVNQVAAFSGNAITISADDAVARNVAIGGFGTCITSTGYARLVLDHVFGDCLNGIYLDNSHDTAKFTSLELWPFTVQGHAYTSLSLPISAAANNGSGKYRVTVSSTSSLVTGDVIGVQTYGLSGAPGLAYYGPVTVVDSTHLDLTNSAIAPSASGTTTNGSTFVSIVTTNLAIGQTVTGTGIPGGTTVAEVWANAITLSQAATASGTVTLSFSNPAYVSGGAIVLDTGLRAGTGLTVSNSESTDCTSCFDYGHQIGVSAGTLAGWLNLVNYKYDSNCNVAWQNVAVSVGSTAYAVNWNGGYTACVNRVFSGFVGGGQTVQSTVSFVNMGGNVFGGALAEVQSGYVNFVGNYGSAGSNSGGTFLIGNSVGGVHFSANDFPTATITYGGSTGQSVTLFDASNRMPLATPGSVTGRSGPVSITGSVTASGQLVSSVATGTAPLSVSSTTQVPNLYAARAALADTVTTNANLTGDVTSVGNATTYAGVLPASKGGAGNITGALKGNGSGVVSQASCADLSDGGSGGCSTSYTTGSWTPTIKIGGSSVGITYSSQLGTYTKIGKRVFADFYITLSSTGGLTGVVTVEGLPYTSYEGANGSAIINSYFALASITQLAMYVGANTTTVYPVLAGSSNMNTQLTHSNLTNTSVLGATAVYSTP